jgi:cupin 2 domain-containing protein
MKPSKDNFFNNIPAIIPEELIETLTERNSLKIERIVSCGHCTPDGQWYDQAWDEWVLILQGEAILAYEDGNTVNMKIGDYVLIPAHIPHRVKWTPPDRKTIWLAIHFTP